MILLDTHTLLWLVSGDENLGSTSKELIDKAYQNEQLGVSAISFWEIALLKKRNRITLDESSDKWRRKILRQGVLELPVTGEIAVHSVNLDNFHADPADRFIVSSALLNDAKLVTADGKILAWKGDLKAVDARN